MSHLEWLYQVLTSEEAKVFYARLASIVTVLSTVFAFYNSQVAKNALLAEKKQRTRKGEVEYGVTYRTEGRFRLAKLAMRATSTLFPNRVREDLFRKSGNEDRTAVVSEGKEPENVGLQDSGDPGENKYFSLTHANLIAEMVQLPTLWAAAGVPSRNVPFLQAFRYDTYSTKDAVDGYQTGRAMLVPLAEVVAAGEDPDFLKSETEIPYQRDRLFHLKEIYRVWKSQEASDKWRVFEIVIPVPEILFLGAEVTSLTKVVAEAKELIATLKQLGGELSDSRLEALADNAAKRALNGLSALLAN